MSPVPHSRSTEEADSLHVGGLARQVLAALQTRTAAPQDDDTLCPEILCELVDSVLGLGAFDGRAVIDDFLAAGICQTDLADRFIPAAARHLGDCWVEDELGFARVTLAAGRLQQMLGELVQANDLLTPADRMTPGVLVLTARDDQHTLGWKLLTLQIRRRGLAARAVPGITVEEGVELVLQAPYELILVSASRLASVEMVVDMIARLRAQMADIPPVVIGGIVAERLAEPCRIPDIDLVTNSLDAALACRRLSRAPVPRVAAE